MGRARKKFLHKFFPINKTIQLRSDIVKFRQVEGQNLYDIREHFKLLLRKCPHHDSNLRSGLDGALGGAFMNNNYE
ncbi:Retrotransposon gag protein [Gossypium australe]|uniref:Retrotransposon gag protein n=1 Tax=Gossypium australe TaxID=47621 RepID=A0A5B6X323_9ROSI|nr:Retrotransposon gag protein [Gossypium australe]